MSIESADEVTAQNVIDALRFMFMANTDAHGRLALVHRLFDYAPETGDDGGIDLIRFLLTEGALKLEATND